MSDDSVTVSIDVDRDLLADMRAVRRRQRTSGRSTRRTAELAQEAPGDIIVRLIREAYQSDLRRERNRGASGGPVGADARYSSR